MFYSLNANCQDSEWRLRPKTKGFHFTKLKTTKKSCDLFFFFLFFFFTFWSWFNWNEAKMTKLWHFLANPWKTEKGVLNYRCLLRWKTEVCQGNLNYNIKGHNSFPVGIHMRILCNCFVDICRNTRAIEFPHNDTEFYVILSITIF